MEAEAWRILIPLDGSVEAASAVAAVMPLVRSRPATVTLFQVIPSEKESPAARAYLAKVEHTLRLHGIRAFAEIEAGRPVERILHKLATESFDFIAMATHFRSETPQFVPESVTGAVLFKGSLPLLICGPPPRIAPWDRIVVALDGWPSAEAILPEVARLAPPLMAEIHLVRVQPPPASRGSFLRFSPGPAPDDPETYLRSVAEKLHAQGLKTRAAVRHGLPAVEILSYAEEAGAGLIAMTTHGRTGWPRALVGSVAEGVLRSTPCSVLIRRINGVPQPLSSSEASHQR